jgi:tetratricopeptide (TPR) repeat protein
LAEFFYKALTQGRSVEDSVKAARVFIRNESRIEWGIPVLYMSSSDGRLFEFETSRRVTPQVLSLSQKLEEFNQLKQSNPSSLEDLERLSELGRQLVGLKKDDVPLAEDVAAVYYNLGLMQQRANDSAKAIASYSYAIELSPKHPEYRIRRANYNARLGAYDLALSDINAAITLEPSNADFFWIKGLIFSMSAGSNAAAKNEAINAFSVAIKLNGNQLKYYLSRADAFAEAGRKEAALIDLDTAIAMDPDNPELIARRRRVEGEEG